jgi:hypothetical protein
MPVDDVLASPFMIVGDIPMIRDHLIEVVERYGTPYLTISEDLGWAIAPVVEELSGR